MSYRYTNTDKWNDSWFTDLKPMEKLLFNYLCDNCDIAGFIEITTRKWATDIGEDQKTIEGALKGLQRGIIFSTTKDCIYLKNFLRHQKNLPLNDKNPAHKGIIKRFELYSYKFDIQNITDFIEGASKGLQCPIGNGNGNGNGKLKEDSTEVTSEKIVKTWKDDFEIYLQECKDAYKKIVSDAEFIKTQARLNPKVDISLSIEKGFTNFWGTEAGWHHKKKSRSKTIDWRATIINSISMNKVYTQK